MEGGILRSELEDTSVLEGPYPVCQGEGRGQQRVMRYTSPPTSAPVYKGDEDIDFIQVTEDMEAFLILERNFLGAGTAGWPSAESSIVRRQPCCQSLESSIICGDPGQPHSWIFHRPPRLQEVAEASVPPPSTF